MKQFSNQDNFYKRLRELADVEARTKSQSLDTTTLVEYVRANDGTALGIIKENDSFYIKSSNVKGDNLHAADFTYIGGLENKLKFKYGSLSEAVKNRNFKLGTINEGLERKFSVAKNLNEEKELLAKTHADQGGIANAQDAADKSKGSEPLKKDAAEKEVAEVGKDGGVAQAQSVADKNKSDDASAKLKQEHEPSTVNGKARTDIAKAQTNADSQEKGEVLKTDGHKEIEVAEVGKDGGEAKAQGEADKHKKSIPLKKDGHKEIEPASDVKKETAIVVENFGKSDGEVEINAADADKVAPNAEPSGSEVASTPDMAAGSAEGDINAAAAALDSLDVAPEAGGAPSAVTAPSTGDEVSADAAAGLDDLGLGDETGTEGGDDAAVLKDIEKLVGKVGQKIRSANIPQEMVIGFLKSIITASEDKLADADSEDKRELAHDIEKAGETGEVSKDGSPDTATADGEEGGEKNSTFGGEKAAEEPAAEKSPEGGEGEEEPDDKDIEEAINAHLQGLSKNMGSNEKPVVNSANNGTQSSKVKPFKGYMEERGYTSESMNDCSVMEMASLVSGYANEHFGDGDADDVADYKTIAEYMSPEVKEAVTEAGHGEFMKKVEPHVKESKVYSSKEPNLMKKEMEEAKKLEEYGNEHPISVEDAVNGKKVEENWHKKDVVNPAEKGKHTNVSVADLHKQLTHAKERGDTDLEKELNFAIRAKTGWGKVNKEDESKKVEESTVEEEKNKVEENKKKAGFAPIGQSMNKAEDESKKGEEDESKEQVSESVKKLRLIVKSKIEEQLGLKKPSLNESAKSKLSKKIDLMVSEEIKKNKDFLKKYNIK